MQQGQKKGGPRLWNPITISLDRSLLKKLDRLRNNIARSKYISLVLEEHIAATTKAQELSD